MARFQYSMQSILNIKLKMETLAKQEFSAAKYALDVEEEKLAALYQRKRDYEEEAHSLRKGALKVREIEDNKNALLIMDQYIHMQRLEVNKAEKQLEQARLRLEDVIKDRKMHETLREKAFESFMQEENKEEGKVVDELTSYTYGQKKQVKE
ncbi:MAG: flagellar export protein FliJ [Lachnospiraceae bacterium]|nr:flagellar export protein FliJ [Lachnospiraceae bacterium]